MPVVFVHGLWLNGLESFLLRDRLKGAGFAPLTFSYPSTKASLAEVAKLLAERLRSLRGTVHVVAHSLGGLIALEAFEKEQDLPPGRAVLLGSPVRGSRAASALAAWTLGPHLLGSMAASELTRERTRRWSGQREIGLIAGSRSAGLGRLFTSLPVPNDGTIAVDETRIAGAKEHLVLDVSHTGMLVSARVAEAVAAFLRDGSFGRAMAA